MSYIVGMYALGINVCMSFGTALCTDVVTIMDVARAAATEVDTIWQLAENSTSLVKLKER
jgi:hypothetical protein